jgi:glycosyltransferase involved in cell wall biosynthesis
LPLTVDRSLGAQTDLPRQNRLGALPMVSLLGRRDSPTDALEDYSELLGEALWDQGVELASARVRWNDTGWLRALITLWHEAAQWRRRWVIVQYTALMWSRRGFPLLFLPVLWLLRIRQVRIAVVFHDVRPYSGGRLIDQARRVFQTLVMRYSYWSSDRSISTAPLDSISWLPRNSSKARFVPVGSNTPAIAGSASCRHKAAETKTIAVFGITGDGAVGNEVADIVSAAKTAAATMPGVRLVTLGRGSAESEARFREALHDSEVEYAALGILSREHVSAALAEADVALFVRGPISTQRGTAIASIACGLPLVAYSSPPLPLELSEAGVIGINVGDRKALAEATIKILADGNLWLELHQRNLLAFEAHFSWEAIAARFAEILPNA